MIIAVLIMTLSVAAEAKEKVTMAFEIESSDSLIRKFDNVARLFGATNQAQQMSSALSKLMQVDNMKGIDTSRKICGYMILPEDASNLSALQRSEPPFVLVLPVTGDGSAYLEALIESMGKPEIRNDIHHFSSKTGHEIFAEISGRHAVISTVESNTALVASAKKPAAIRVGLIDETPGVLRVGIDITKIMPLMRSVAQETTSQMKNTSSMSSPAGQSINHSQLAKAQMDLLLTLLKDMKSVRIAIDHNMKKSVVEIRSDIEALPETEMAEALDAISPASKAYRNLVPGDAPIKFVAGGIQAFDYFIDPYFSFLGEINESMGPVDESIERMEKALKEVKGLYSGGFTMGLVPADGGRLATIQAVEIKSKQLAMDYIKKNLVDYNETYAGLSPGFSIKTMEPRTHKNITIQRFSYIIDLSNATQTPQSQQPSLPSWLKNMQTEFAVVNENMIQTMGSPTIMNNVIKRLKDGKTAVNPVEKNQLFERLFSEGKYNPVLLYTIKPLSAVKSILAALPGANRQMLNMIPDSPGGIAGYAVKDGNRIKSVTRITLDEILTMKNSASAIGGLYFQAIMSGMAGPQPEAPSEAQATSECVNNLKLLDAAKEQAALDQDLKKGNIVPLELLGKYLPGGRLPACPENGSYSVNPVGTPPECSFKGHSLAH